MKAETASRRSCSGVMAKRKRGRSEDEGSGGQGDGAALDEVASGVEAAPDVKRARHGEGEGGVAGGGQHVEGGASRKKEGPTPPGESAGPELSPEEQALASLGGSRSSAETKNQSNRFLQFYDSLTPDQQRRYEAFRRSRIHPDDVREMLGAALGPGDTRVTKPASIVVAGLTKLFVGDIVERARVIMEKRKEKGAICPRHLRDAYRQLKQTGQLPLMRSSGEALRR